MLAVPAESHLCWPMTGTMGADRSHTKFKHACQIACCLYSSRSAYEGCKCGNTVNVGFAAKPCTRHDTFPHSLTGITAVGYTISICVTVRSDAAAWNYDTNMTEPLTAQTTCECCHMRSSYLVVIPRCSLTCDKGHLSPALQVPVL